MAMYAGTDGVNNLLDGNMNNNNGDRLERSGEM